MKIDAHWKWRVNRYVVSMSLFFGLSAVWLCGVSPGAAMEKTTSSPVILSASEVDYPPFCIAHEDGRVEGFSVELLRAAVRAMGRDVVFRIGLWTEVKGWLERGEVQALPLVGRTLEREEFFDFTFPYMSLHGAIVVRRDTQDIDDLDDLRGRKVAVMEGDNAEEFLRREDRGIDIRRTATFEDALRELSEGRHDAVVIQKLVALRLIQETGLENLRVVNKPIEGFRQDFVSPSRRGDRETLALLNEGLALVIADGTYRQLHVKWFAGMELPTHRRIVVGGDHNYPPYEFLDSNGRPDGFIVELTKAIARELELDIEIRLGPWTKIVDGLENGEIDVIQGMFYSQERDLKFDFTQPHAVNHYVTAVRKGEGSIPGSLEELAGRRIVVQGGDIVHDFLVNNKLGDRISVVETQEDAMRGLAEGHYDCAVVVRMSALHLIEKHGWTNLVLGHRPILSTEYCYAVLNNRKALLAQFSEGLKILEQTGEYRRIYEKWLGVYKEQPPSLVGALRYPAMVLVPLLMVILAFSLWSWSLRRQVASRTRDLNESERLLLAIINAIAAPIYYKNAEGVFLGCNQAFSQFVGLPKESIIGKTVFDLTRDEYAQQYHEADMVLMKEGRNQVYETEVLDNNGTVHQVMFHKALFRGTDGAVEGIVGAILDITGRKRAEEALKESEAFIRAVMDHLPIGVAVNSLDPGVSFTYMNDNFPRLYRTTREALSIPDAFWDVVYEDPAFREEIRKRVLDDCASDDSERMHWEDVPIMRNGMDTAFICARNVPVPGKPLMISTVWDVTDRRRAEDEREKLQAQLSQAQRLESVGRLAGGVAHDFNNMLGVILGRAELALERVEPGHPLEVDLQEILHAAGRSAEITRQLLAFARKQTIAPVVLDLNETVEGMLRMIRRLIGEDIDLAWLPRTGLWPVRMDPSQLDQVLANLCVNARDAIHGVGKVTIETDRVVFDEAYCADHPDFVPGRYVMLAVSDDGCGMDGETLDRIFEPFFTTKEAGRGTGLGLSTVHGIVRQNGGFIHVYSESGKGTTFRIYLPPCEDEERQTQAAGSEEMPLGRGETVLVVEDDESILKMTQTMLDRLGYPVLAVGTTAEAERLSEEYSGEIHLLITDVIMPGMNGRDLAERCRAARPGMKCLFMSGYTANVIAHQAVLDEGVHFIQKPFSMEELAVKVQRVLNNE